MFNCRWISKRQQKYKNTWAEIKSRRYSRVKEGKEESKNA